MRSGGVVIMTVATLLVCCCAYSRQEQDLSEEHSRDNFDAADYRQKEALENFLKFLLQYEHAKDRAINGGSTTFGRYTDGLGGLSGRQLGYTGNNFNSMGSSLRGRSEDRYARFVDSLGGGNFVRNLDSIGGGNFVRNLDSIGGSNFVKKNLDHIGGPNLVKRTLDSLGGGNFVRNLDSIGGGNFVRQIDPLGGGNFV